MGLFNPSCKSATATLAKCQKGQGACLKEWAKKEKVCAKKGDKKAPALMALEMSAEQAQLFAIMAQNGGLDYAKINRRKGVRMGGNTNIIDQGEEGPSIGIKIAPKVDFSMLLDLEDFESSEEDYLY